MTAVDVVSLRYSPGATAISTTSPPIGDRTLASASALVGVHAKEPQTTSHVVVRGACLLECGRRHRELRLGHEHVFLGDGPVGEQIAQSAHVGFRLRDGRLALLDVSPRLAPRRLQLRDVRGLERQQHLAGAHAIAERDGDVTNASGHRHSQTRDAPRNGFDLSGNLEFIDREVASVTGATRMRSS